MQRGTNENDPIWSGNRQPARYGDDSFAPRPALGTVENTAYGESYTDTAPTVTLATAFRPLT
jgi:hypothetical protein